MIKRVAIEHFKSIEKLDLQLGPLTVVVGPNGSGKSNFVDALRFVRDAAEWGLDHAVSERHGIESVRQWSPSRSSHVSFEINLATFIGDGFLSFILSSTDGQYRVEEESASWSAHRKYRRPNQPLQPMRLPSLERYQRDSDGLRDGTKLDIPKDELWLGGRQAAGFPLQFLFRALTDIGTYAIFPDTLRAPQKPTHTTVLSSTGDNLTSVFKALTRSRRLVPRREEILAALRKVMPNLDSIRIQSLGGLMIPTFRVREPDGKSHDFNVSQISDGTLRLLGLLTALYQPDRPAVIAMEEPEQTVNPGVLGVLADAIREVSEEGTQIVITTHSPHLVDLFEPEQILTAELIDGKTVIRPIDESQKQAVKDRLFSLGELMTAEGLHG